MKKTLRLNKINKTNNTTVRTLGGCHCGCKGHAGSGYGNGYMGSWF